MEYGIIIGILAGFIASRLTGGDGKGCIINLLLGMVGGVVGGWLFGVLNITAAGWTGELITATVGAVLVIWICNRLF